MALTALLILDRTRLRSQYAQLGRLAVALTANGCRINTLVPDPPFGDNHPADKPIGLSESTRYEEQVAPWLRSVQIEELKKTLERDPPDLLWAAGRRTWRLATALAQALERPLVPHLAGYEEARHLRRVGRNAPIAGVIAPTRQLEELVSKERTDCDIQLVVPGIAISEQDELLRQRNEDGPISIAILGSGRSPRPYRALFEGLASLRDRGQGFRLALELPADNDQRIWRQLRRFEFTELTTAIDDPARMPKLIAASDLIIRPVAEHRVRPIVLQAMAEGTPVATVAEPWLDYLSPKQGATVIEPPNSSGWAAALEPLLLDDAERTRLGRLARQAVINDHRSSDRADAVMALFERIVGVDPIPLPNRR